MILYTVGDSFTYGLELDNPDQQAWPRLLANMMGADLDNRSRPGVSNEYIIKKTIDAVSEYKPDFAIIAWTSAGRREMADQTGVYTIWPGGTPFVVNGERHRSEVVKYVTAYSNEMHEYRNWLRQVILLQSFLDQNKIPYIFVNAFDNQIRNKEHGDQNKNLWELINTTRFIGWPYEGMVEWAWPCARGPKGHFLDEGHKKIAQHIYEGITNDNR